jgi:chromosome partitioning protein
MHLAIGLMKEGRRVACLDLDFQQRTLSTYIENRGAWAKEKNMKLDVPTNLCIDGFKSDKSFLSDSARISLLSSALSAYEADHDSIIIDTPGGANAVTIFAHGLADTLITPVNDSFLDLDVIFRPKTASGQVLMAPQYTETVRRALEARRTVTRKKMDWLVVRNRMLSLGSRNAREVLSVLDAAAKASGFRVANGLSERVIFREFFSSGLTAFDSLETSLLGVKPATSHVLARLEVRHLLAAVQQPPTYEERVSWNASELTPRANGRHSDKVNLDKVS